MDLELLLSGITKDDNKSVQLGKWCSSSVDLLNERDQILKYHWDDKDQFHHDLYFIKENYPNLLYIISKKLNKFHEEDNSLEYWEIIIGPWLIVMMSVLYDRWKVVNSIDSKNLFFYKIPLNDFFHIPYDYQEFTKCIENDLWNHCLYSELLKDIDIECKDIPIKKINKLNKAKVSFSNSVRKNIFLFKSKKSLFINTSVGVKNIIKLSLLFGELFLPVIKKASFKKNSVDKGVRSSLISDNEKYNHKFIKLFLKKIDILMPRAYLEDYKKIKYENIFNFLPRNIENIFSETLHISDDFFKIWLANQQNTKAKLLIFQHGGSNSESVNLLRDYEKKISDVYFSWGGDNDGGVQLGSYKIKRFVKNRNFFYRKKLLFISSQVSKHFSQPISIPISGQIIYDYYEQFIFFKNLNRNVFGRSEIRVNPRDFGWNQEDFFKAHLKGIKIDENKSLYSSLRSSSLVVITYNGTTLLEVFSSNIPVVIVLNKYNNHIDKAYSEIFKSLRRANILFDNYIDASNHVNEVWNDIGVWWNCKSTEVARKQFIKKFLFSHESMNKMIYEAISEK